MKNNSLKYFTVLLILVVTLFSFKNKALTSSNQQPNHRLNAADIYAADVLPTSAEALPTEDRKHPSKKIKIALLLDTSGSMDGLLHQAKSQLWEMVNKLADASCDGLKPSVEIALYEYGNDGLSSRNGFIRLVTPLTQNLDQLSEDLFALTTNGGSEYCGQVIQTSLNQLSWSENSNDLQLIFIAGNEHFGQGPINYTAACKQAATNNVVVNTIFCGDFNEGIQTSWQRGARLTKGEYMSINHNTKTVYIASPYDSKITQLNEQLNATYVYYGNQGKLGKQKQVQQDNNAKGYGSANMVNRAVTKSKHVYKNSSWDLVDALEENENIIEEVKEEELSAELRELTNTERTAFIKEKAEQRMKLKQEISELAQQREAFLKENANKKQTQSLDNVMLSAITKQAKLKDIRIQ